MCYIPCHDTILNKSKEQPIRQTPYIYNSTIQTVFAAALAQWVRAFAPQAEGWVFESQPRQTQVAKTGSDSSTAKRSDIDVNVSIL